VGAFGLEFEHDHVEHLYPDRDSGFIEATGRRPATYTFTAIFRNGLAGFKSPPYPTEWRKFVGACLDRSTAPLVHPELGELKAKCKSLRTQWDPMRRDGVEVDVTFRETTDSEDELAAAFEKVASYPTADAGDLDNALGNISPTPKLPAPLPPSLLDSLKQLSGAIQQAKLGLGNVGGLISSYVGALDSLRQQLEGLGNPSTYKALASIDAMIVALLDIQTAPVTKSKPISQATVKADAPLASVASFFRMKLDDFLRLNPGLASKTTVSAGTMVLISV